MDDVGESARTHEWTDGAWSWGLLLDDPMDPDDLARVVRSIPSL